MSRYRVGPLPTSLYLEGVRDRVLVLADRCEDSLRGPSAASEGAGVCRWHLLFAGPQAFRRGTRRQRGAPSQAEAMLRAHPALLDLDRWLVGAGLPTAVEEAGVAAPFLVRDVPCGANPARRSNILALAAPPTGFGPYWEEEIRHALRSAAGAWAAAIAESDGRPVEIHGGFWGCGRLGGNRELMVTIQVLATLIAGVDRVVLHTSDREGEAIAGRAIDETAFLLARLAPHPTQAVPTVHLIDALLDRGYRWGVPTPASPAGVPLRRSA